jgi:hypothetical protein
LSKYPSGLISQQATFLLESLAKAKITSQKDRNGVQQLAGEPRFRVGDTWESAVIDDWTGNELRRFRSVVSRIKDGLVYVDSELGQTIRTLDGATIKTNGSEFDPPRIDLPGGEIAVGQKWAARTIQKDRKSTFWRDEDFKVVGLENLTTPAGTFKAFKLEAIAIQQSGARVKRTYWVEPGWGVILKVSRVITPPNAYGSNGQTRDTVVLVSRTRGPA